MTASQVSSNHQSNIVGVTSTDIRPQALVLTKTESFKGNYMSRFKMKKPKKPKVVRPMRPQYSLEKQKSYTHSQTNQSTQMMEGVHIPASLQSQQCNHRTAATATTTSKLSLAELNRRRRNMERVAIKNLLNP